MGATPQYSLYYPNPRDPFRISSHDLKTMQNTVDGAINSVDAKVEAATDAAEAAEAAATAAQQTVEAVGYSDISFDIDGNPYIGVFTSQFLSGRGKPLNKVLPDRKGQIYIDTDGTGDVYLWLSTGATKDDWTQMYQDMSALIQAVQESPTDTAVATVVSTDGSESEQAVADAASAALTEAIGDTGSSTYQAIESAAAGAVETELEDSNSASYAAAQSAALAKIKDWESSYRVKATDYGVQTGLGVGDQTAALQASMDAAAAQGADLELPGGRIPLTGQLIWRTHRHSIISTQATTLDWSGATIDGPVLLTNGSRGPLVVAGGTVYSAVMSNVYVLGPTDPSTTTDFIQFEGKVVEDQNSVYGVTLDRVTVIGFRRQECYGSYTWLIHHYDCTFTKWIDAAIYWYGEETCGENIRYVGGAFAKGKDIVRAMVDGAGIDMYFAGVSFDFNTGPLVTASNGTYGFTDCHMEWGGTGGVPNTWDTLNNLVELTSNTAATRTPSVHFSGGEVVLQGEYIGTGVIDVAVVKTITSSGQPPIVVSADGLVIRDFAKRHGLLTLEFHQETGLPLPSGNTWDQSYPLVRFNGHLSLRGPGYSYARVGEACNQVLDGGFTQAIASPVSNTNHGMGLGWETPDPTNAEIDSSVFHSGTSSVKINADGNVGIALQQQISLTPGKTYHCSFWYKTDSVAVGTNYYAEVRHYPDPDSGGASIGGKGQSKKLSGGTNDWAMEAFWFKVPPGAAVSIPCFSVYKTEGTIWVTEFQIAEIS